MHDAKASARLTKNQKRRLKKKEKGNKDEVDRQLADGTETEVTRP